MKKPRKRVARQIEGEVWWMTFEHPLYGETKVCLRWERVHGNRGLYAAVVTALEFDLFTPPDEQDALTAMVRASNIRAVAPMGDPTGDPDHDAGRHAFTAAHHMGRFGGGSPT
jgi:hypothetical protein